MQFRVSFSHYSFDSISICPNQKKNPDLTFHYRRVKQTNPTLQPWQRWHNRVLRGRAVPFLSRSASSHDVVSPHASPRTHKLLWFKHRLHHHLLRPETALAPFSFWPCHVPMTCKPRPEPWHVPPMPPSTTRNSLRPCTVPNPSRSSLSPLFGYPFESSFVGMIRFLSKSHQS